jgi:hypothetical protein
MIHLRYLDYSKIIARQIPGANQKTGARSGERAMDAIDRADRLCYLLAGDQGQLSVPPIAVRSLRRGK